MSKKTLIKLLNNQFKNNIYFQSSEKTQYVIHYKSIKDIVPIFNKLYKYFEEDLVHSLCVHTSNDELKLMFFVNFGYNDFL